MSILKRESVGSAVAVIVIALVALGASIPIGSSVTISDFAVKGTVHIFYPPCPWGVVCSPIYEIKGMGGPACAFQNPTVVSQTVCPLVLQGGTWIMYFTTTTKLPKQGQHIIAYGTEIVPSKNGSNYAGDLYVSSWIRAKSNPTT